MEIYLIRLTSRNNPNESSVWYGERLGYHLDKIMFADVFDNKQDAILAMRSATPPGSYYKGKVITFKQVRK